MPYRHPLQLKNIRGNSMMKHTDRSKKYTLEMAYSIAYSTNFLMCHISSIFFCIAISAYI